MLVFIVVFADYHSTALQIFLVMAVFIFISWAQKRHRPYSDEKLNQIERISLVSVSLINLCALYFAFVADVPDLDNIESEAAKMVLNPIINCFN